MKNYVKTLIFGLLGMFFALSITSCGNESEDPQPSKNETKKTNLEIVKEDIIGTWEFVSAEVSLDEDTRTHTGGGCGVADDRPDWFVANIISTDYTFLAGDKLEIFRHCHGILYTDNLTYSVSEVDKKIVIEMSTGMKFELITSPEKIKEKTLKVKSLYLMKGATNAIFEFKKK